MSVRIVRLGSSRGKGEGLRIGTVRRPPRGVRKADYAAKDWFDVWFPTLAPTPAVMKLGLAARSDRDRARFFCLVRAEMKQPAARHALELLATLSRHADFSVGCYCEDETHCHRSVLRELLRAGGARLAR